MFTLAYINDRIYLYKLVRVGHKFLVCLYVTQNPSSTTRQVDECNLSSVQDCDVSLKMEDHGTDLEAVGIENNESRKSDIYGGTTDVLDWSSHNDLDYETTRSMHPEGNGHLSSDPENKDGKLEQLSLPTDEAMEKIKGGNYFLILPHSYCFLKIILCCFYRKDKSSAIKCSYIQTLWVAQAQGKN